MDATKPDPVLFRPSCFARDIQYDVDRSRIIHQNRRTATLCAVGLTRMKNLNARGIALAASALALVWTAAAGCRSSAEPERTAARKAAVADMYLEASVRLSAGDIRNRFLDWAPLRGVLMGVVTRPGRRDSGDPGVMMLARLGAATTPATGAFIKDALFGPSSTIFYLDLKGRLWHADANRRTLIDDRVWRGAALSPDGRLLTYVRETRPFFTEMKLYDLDASSRRTLVAGPAVNDRPAFAADGSSIVYVSGQTSLASLWTVPVSGGPPVQVTNVGLRPVRGQRRPPEGFVPVPVGVRTMRCTGRFAYFTVGGSLWRVDLETGAGRRMGEAEALLGIDRGKLAVRSKGAIREFPVEVSR
jgi:hypothetical protein